MFTITSTRIVGLIAVVCAAVVAPQALAMPIIDSQEATPTIIAPPADGIQGYDLSGLDPSVLNGIRSYQQQEEYLRGLPRAALAAAGLHKSVKVQPESLWQSPLGPGGIVRAPKGGKAASTASAIKALQRRSVDLNAAYRKLYPGAYRHGSLQTNPGWGAAATAAKSVTVATFFYTPTNAGWGAAATAAKQSAATLAVNTAPLGWFCFDQAKYEYVNERCQ